MKSLVSGVVLLVVCLGYTATAHEICIQDVYKYDRLGVPGEGPFSLSVLTQSGAYEHWVIKTDTSQFFASYKPDDGFSFIGEFQPAENPNRCGTFNNETCIVYANVSMTSTNGIDECFCHTNQSTNYDYSRPFKSTVHYNTGCENHPQDGGGKKYCPYCTGGSDGYLCGLGQIEKRANYSGYSGRVTGSEVEAHSIFEGWDFYGQVEYGTLWGPGMEVFYEGVVDSQTTKPTTCQIEIGTLPLPQAFCNDTNALLDGHPASGYGVNAADMQCGFSSWFKCEEVQTQGHLGDFNFGFKACPETASPTLAPTPAPTVTEDPQGDCIIRRCGDTISLSNIALNNLGGVGPGDSAEEIIKYVNVFPNKITLPNTNFTCRLKQDNQSGVEYMILDDVGNRSINGVRTLNGASSEDIGQISLVTEGEVYIECTFEVSGPFQGVYFDIFDVDQTRPQFGEKYVLCGVNATSLSKDVGSKQEIGGNINKTTFQGEGEEVCHEGISTASGFEAPNPFSRADVFDAKQNAGRAQFGLPSPQSSFSVRYTSGTPVAPQDRTIKNCCSRNFFFSACERIETIFPGRTEAECNATDGGEWIPYDIE